MKVAIVGCGLIGRKRAAALGPHRLVAVTDPDRERAEALALFQPGTVVVPSFREAVGREDVDIVIVATTHDQLAPITLAALEAGKNVLVEKPGPATRPSSRPWWSSRGKRAAP